MMPGIIFVLNNRRAEQADKTNLLLNAMSGQCFRNQSASIEDHILDNNMAVRFVKSQKSEPFGLCKGDHWHIAFWGFLKFNGAGLGNSMASVLEAGLEKDWLDTIQRTFSGSYQALLYNCKQKLAFCLNDKISTHPWYLLATDDCFMGAPEVLCFRAVKKHVVWGGEIDEAAVPEFMASGHLWGERSFFKGVKRLGPGRFAKSLPIGSDSKFASYETGSHFKLAYNNEKIPRPEITKTLSDAIDRDLKDLPSGKGVITLSGGWDSRALAGYAKKAGLDFDCVSYTFGTGVMHNSDAECAKDIAEHLDVSWSVYLSGGNNLVNNIEEVIQATGGETDMPCAQDAFLGKDFYGSQLSGYDYLLRADEVWGWGDYVNSLDSSFFQCFLFNLNEIRQPKLLLTQQAYTRYVNELSATKSAIAKQSESARSRDYNDFKDELYWYNRESRLLQNMAHYRRSYIPHIAPFLLDNTLATIQKIPAEQRIRKGYFISAIRSVFPGLYLRGDNVSRNKMGYELEYAISNNADLRLLIRDVLVCNPPPEMACVCNTEALTEWVDGILHCDKHHISKGRHAYNVLKRINDLAKKFPHLREYLFQMARKTGALKFPMVNSVYLFRLLVLGLALREYKKAS